MVPRDSDVISFVNILAPIPSSTYKLEVTKGHIEVVFSLGLQHRVSIVTNSVSVRNHSLCSVSGTKIRAEVSGVCFLRLLLHSCSEKANSYSCCKCQTPATVLTPVVSAY